MECEVCGRTVSQTSRILIDKSEMNVCDSCKSLGNEIHENKPIELKKMNVYEIEERTLETNFGEKIRKSRDRMGLSQEEAAKKAGVQVSVLHRVESGRFVPDDKTAKKLEKFFKVRIVQKTDNDLMDLLDK